MEVKLGLTLLDVATKAGIGIRSECGGLGVCGKCLVVVEDQSNLSPITDAEIRSVPSEKLKAGYRLACQSIVKGSVTVTVPPESRLETRKIMAEGLLRPFQFDPGYVDYFIMKVVSARPSDVRDIASLVLEHGIPQNLLTRIGQILPYPEVFRSKLEESIIPVIRRKTFIDTISIIDPLPFWRAADESDRQGITEIKYIEGLYA